MKKRILSLLMALALCLSLLPTMAWAGTEETPIPVDVTDAEVETSSESGTTVTLTGTIENGTKSVILTFELNAVYESGTTYSSLEHTYNLTLSAEIKGADGDEVSAASLTVTRAKSGLAVEIVATVNMVGSSEYSLSAHWDDYQEHDGVKLEPWESDRSLPTTAGNYYLDTDVTLDATWTVPTGEVNLCLNGHVIKQTAEASVITVGEGATLNLYDCGTKTEHAGYVDANGLWHLDATNEHNGLVDEKDITGGIITGGNKATQLGGGVHVYENGSFTMHGGSIIGNTAKYGGGVYVNFGSSFTMHGGSIIGNTATTNGGGVYVNGGSSFTMNGGEITRNSAVEYGGGVFALGTTIVGGTAYIRGNETTGSGAIAESNIHLNNSAKTLLKVSSEKPLTDGAGIGITIWASSGWAPSTEVGSYLGGTMTDSNYQYFVMNNSGSANKGTVYKIVKDTANSQYVLADTFAVTGYESEGGTVTPDKTEYTNRDTVTLTVTPSSGYQLKSLTATPVAPTISTIADVLATVEGFPKDIIENSSPTAPSDAWTNGTGSAFTYKNLALVLKSSSYMYAQLTTGVTFDATNKCYTATVSTLGTLKFNMTDGVLTSFTYTHKEGKPEQYDGTYTPASTPSARLKPITPEKQTDGTYQFTMPDYAVTVTAEFEKKAITIADIIATYENFPLTKDEDLYWTNKQGTTCYYFNNNLFFRYTSTKSLMQSMTVSVAADGKNYTYSDGTVTYTFIMDDSGVLAAITVSGSTDEKYNGTYGAPPTKYTVTNGTTDMNGDIAIDKASAAEGETVTITVTPAEGYQLKKLTVLSAISIAPPITPAQDASDKTKYTFKMPSYPVRVTAEFEEKAITIADILPDDFPTCVDVLPPNLWVNGNEVNMMVVPYYLVIFTLDGDGNPDYVTLADNIRTATLTKNGNNYTYTNNGVTTTFLMSDNGLESVKIEGLTGEYVDFNGTYGEQHAHSFTYTVNGGKLTATCTQGCDMGYDTTPLTLTLTAPTSLVYDGNAKVFTFADGEAAAWTGAGLELPTIYYYEKKDYPFYMGIDSAPTDAGGDYMVEITVNKKAAQICFTIDKATPYIKTTPAPTDIEYGKKLSDSTLFGGYVQISSTDSSEVGGLFEWTNPDTAPGIDDSEITEYDVTFTPADTNNYNTVSCKITIKVTHIHNLIKVTGQAATETEAGFKDYYECECGDLFEDATGLIPIENLDAWKSSAENGYLAPLVHTVTPVNGQDATDTEAGYKAYYECKNCGKYYEDATGLIEISDINVWKAEGGNGYLAPLHGTDDNHDHICDYCDRQVSECADENKDHKCDYCGETLSECADENKDHKCDYCGKVLSECADENKDHKCDLCGKVMSDHVDANCDHICDYCGDEVYLCPSDKFTDAPKYDNWAHVGIDYCVVRDLMKGISNTEFAPQLTTSRAMFVTSLWRLEGAPVVNYAMSFTDVAPDQWYTEAIRWAQANGIVSGYSAEKFGINDPITREQMAAILYRYAQTKGEGFTGSWMFLLDFDDRADISGWADEAMHWCVMKNIIVGVGNNLLDPQGRATREQVAAILHRFCENIVK